MKVKILILLAGVIVLAGCGKPADPRVNVREGVKSDTLGDHYLIRPVKEAFSILLGEGIGIKDVVTKRNDAGLLEVHIAGFNESYKTRRFRYRVEWLDENAMVIETKTSVWLPMSAMGKQPFGFKAVAPRLEAVNFRIDTKKWE